MGDNLSIVVLGLVPLLILLFPDGRLPARGWRLLVWIIVGTSVVLTVANALLPYQLAGDPRMPPNPTGIHGAQDSLEALTFPAAIILLCAGLASLKALGIRYAQSQGVERQQLKWFLYGTVILVLTLIALTPLVWNGILLPILVGFGLFSSCIAIALLRYHLYDIDRLINRSLVYGTLTVLLGLVYAVGVFGPGDLLNPAGEDSALAVAASTLAVAALFQPARRRVQTLVDRRFNRRRYNATRTVDAFSIRLRDQVDLDTLTEELLAVVEQTMEPSVAWLWLRPSAKDADTRPTVSLGSRSS